MDDIEVNAFNDHELDDDLNDDLKDEEENDNDDGIEEQDNEEQEVEEQEAEEQDAEEQEAEVEEAEVEDADVQEADEQDTEIKETDDKNKDTETESAGLKSADTMPKKSTVFTKEQIFERKLNAILDTKIYNTQNLPNIVSKFHRNIVTKEVSRTGDNHTPVFTMIMTANGIDYTGVSTSKKKAKNEAAKKIIAVLRAKYFPNKEFLDLDNAGNNGKKNVVKPNAEIPKETDRNPIYILLQSRPHISYTFTNLDKEATDNYTMEAVLDKIVYKGEGETKAIAKYEVALKICTDKFGIKFTKDTKPLAKKENIKAKKTETIVKIPTKTKKNFVAFLAEFKPNRNYQFMEKLVGKYVSYVVECTVDSAVYIGKSKNKKGAKNQAAQLACKALFPDVEFCTVLPPSNED